MGIILSITKFHAYNQTCTEPIIFIYTEKSQKKNEVKLDCSINKTVCCFFLTTHVNYVGMAVVYKEIYYTYGLGVVFEFT